MRSQRPISSLLLSLILILCGIVIIIWSLVSAAIRDLEGFLTGRVLFPISVGIAFWITALLWARNLRNFVFWFSLAIISQAAALQLIEAGKEVRYQHYVPASQLLTSAYVLFSCILLVQVLVVLVGLRTHIRSILSWIVRNFRLWQIVLLVVIFVITSAALSRELDRYLYEIIVAAMVQVVFLANLGLAFVAIPEDIRISWTARFNDWLDHGETGPVKAVWFSRHFNVLAALWVALLALFLSYFIYQSHPHVQDEVIYLFHARYLAEGLLKVPAPAVPEAFTLYMIPYKADQWYSIFPPGWPAILSLGVLVGAPWLVNPILGGVGILLAERFVREIYDKRTARLAVLLLAFSPWYIFLSMSFMAHVATLVIALFAAIAVAKARKTGFIIWAILAGAAVGAISLIRLPDGLIVGLLLGLWAIGLGGKRLRTVCLVAFGISIILVMAINLGYNALVSGKPLAFPLDVYYEEYFGPKSNAMGFGPERGLGWALDAFPGHSPLEAVLNAALNAFYLNIELFGWATGSLLFAAIALFSGRLIRSDYLMIAVIGVIIAVLSLYWFSGGPDFGARYWFLMIIPMVALTVRGIQILEEKLWINTNRTMGTGLGILVVCLCVMTLFNFLPWRSIDKYFHYLGMRPDVRELASEYNFGKSIVLVRGSLYPDYQSAWVYNPITADQDGPIYAWDKSPEVRGQVQRAYQDRPVWIIDGPSLTNKGFQVIAGPLSGSSATNETTP